MRTFSVEKAILWIIYFSWKQWFEVKCLPYRWICFLQTCIFLYQKINWWTHVDYCDIVYISCLDSHSDGTHSQQRILLVSIALAAQRLWVQFPGNTHADKTFITWMYCKSLWIKASAKCININVIYILDDPRASMLNKLHFLGGELFLYGGRFTPATALICDVYSLTLFSSQDVWACEWPGVVSVQWCSSADWEECVKRAILSGSEHNSHLSGLCGSSLSKSHGNHRHKVYVIITTYCNAMFIMPSLNLAINTALNYQTKV